MVGNIECFPKRYTIFTLPFTVWVLTTFMKQLPMELEEAAIMDGATPWVTITKVFLPLMWPAMATTGLLAFIAAWNEFLFALILTRRDAVTLPVGLVSFRTERGDLWELMSAAGVMITVPIFIMALLIQKHFTRGMTAGAVK